MNPFFEEVLAVALRDWKKSGKLWKFLLVLTIMGAFIYGVGFSFERIVSASFYSGNYSSFFSFSFLVYLIFLVGITNGSAIIVDREKFVKLLLVAPISKYSLLFGKALSTLTGSLRLFIPLGLFFLFLSQQLSFGKLFSLILYCIFLVIVGVATGLFLSTLSKNRTTSTYITNFFTFALLFLSGILFPTSSLPEKLQLLFKINPFVYITDLFRFLMLGISDFPLLTDLLISLVFGTLIVFLGVYQFDKNLRN